MHFVNCSFELHASQMLEIINDVILTSTALYDYHPRTLASMADWFRSKRVAQYPVIGAAAECGRLIGFATYGVFRAWPAYKYSVEHSVYLHKDHRGKGFGLALMRQMIDEARQQQYHVLVGGIDLTNQASIALHEKLGFKHAGTIEQAGFKFGRWLDLAYYQLVLDTPTQPIDG
jgi:phosphinothricin acetyltransferase